jgi:hypothetical protein
MASPSRHDELTDVEIDNETKNFLLFWACAAFDGIFSIGLRNGKRWRRETVCFFPGSIIPSYRAAGKQ